MREICTHGSEGGAGQTNASSLPLSSAALGMTNFCVAAIYQTGVYKKMIASKFEDIPPTLTRIFLIS